jgi:histidinol-phosphatase (PHP family)
MVALATIVLAPATIITQLLLAVTFMLIPHDYHLHSNFSCDGHATIREQCASAIASGIPEIGFTEHYDLHPLESCRDWLRLDEWAAEIDRARAEFTGRLSVRAGIEIGEPHLFQPEAQAMLQRYPFDYAIGSLHFVGDQTVFAEAYFQRPADEAYRLYFEELERMTRLGSFDVLGHLDVIIRTACRIYGEYHPRQYEAYIRPVLRNCIERGIALDINARGRRGSARRLSPDVEILTWYAEMGGERVTLGSDAHRSDEVGRDLDVALGAARAAGLKSVTMFEQREARMKWIE